MVIPEKEVPEFKQLLVKFYEGEDISVILPIKTGKSPSDFYLFFCEKIQTSPKNCAIITPYYSTSQRSAAV